MWKSAAEAAVVRSCGGCGRSPSARHASYVSRPSDSELPRIADPGPGRQRLARQEQPGVHQLGDGVDPDDAGLPQQRGDGRVRQPGRPYCVPLGRGRVPGALDHDQWLRRGRAAGEAGELAGVADRLQVHEDDVGVGVLVPVLEDVVAGDVGPVAGGDEGGDAGHARDAAAAPVQPGQQGDADGAGLGEQADAARARRLGREGGVEPYPWGGVDDAEGVRPDDPHAVRARVPHECALAFAPLGAALGVSGGDHDQPLHAVFAALGDDLGHMFGRHGDDREVDRAVDVPHRAVGGNPVELLLPLGQCPVHGVEAAGVPGVADVAEDAAAHAARGAPGSDDGDRAGGEQPLHGPGLGAMLARVLHGEGAVGGFEVELQTDDAVLEAAFLRVPGVCEHLDHFVVGGQHLGGEAADAALAGDGGDVFQESGGDAPALVGVLHQEGDLGLVGGRGRGRSVRADPVVAYGGDELAADCGRESHPVHKVVVREAVDVLGGQARVRREEAVVLRLVGDLLVEADQALGVINGDGPDARGATVAQHHVGFPVGGILVPVRRGLHGPQSTSGV
ncbi:hypothetical protein STAFG_4823 [Streptomyces afghaniensis 772]|uniref:Uncharacterized protein n=1 Tax=Streptomyces afghaniensis 772 TaxID=1283301 RepID=S4MF80_9ACTN|nr:hypothetical protein STAFG_4823 [Streptomyces afghaniensis 772]